MNGGIAATSTPDSEVPIPSRRYPQIATATSFQFPVGAVA